jgi:prefoldin subunit 5
MDEVKKELNKLSVSVHKLDIHCLEVLIPVYRLLYISANIEAADCIIVKVPNNLLLLSSEVPNNTRG